MVVCLCLVVAVVLGALGCTPKAAPPPTTGPANALTQGAQTAPAGDLGEQIVKTGIGAKGQHVAFTGGSDRFKAKPGGCVGCHNEDGRGRKLPKGQIPPITYSALRGGDKPLFPSDDLVIRAMREGKDEKGEALQPMMPHWQLTDAEATAVLSYLKQFDLMPPIPEKGKPAAKPEAKPKTVGKSEKNVAPAKPAPPAG